MKVRALIHSISIIFLSSLILSGCQKAFPKFKAGQCLTEKLRAVASSHPSSVVTYKIKAIENGQYVLYVARKKKWWFYQKIAWQKFQDGSRGEFEKVRCPQLVKTSFGNRK